MNWRSCMFTQHTTPRVQKPNTCCYRDAVTGRTTCSRDCRECCRCRRCCSVLRMRKCGEKCLARVSLSLSRALCELKGGLTTKWNTSRKIQCGWHKNAAGISTRYLNYLLNHGKTLASNASTMVVKRSLIDLIDSQKSMNICCSLLFELNKNNSMSPLPRVLNNICNK